MRIQSAITLTRRHTIAASALTIAAPCLAVVSPNLAVATTGCAALVASALYGTIAMLRSLRRERIHDLIVLGSPPPLPLIRDEVGQLLDGRYRARVARSLNRALYEGEHWHEYLPASRPPPGVRNLPANGPLVREITTDLYGEHVSPRAVILLARLMRGGYGAAIYQGGPDWLGRELGRIHFELIERTTSG